MAIYSNNLIIKCKQHFIGLKVFVCSTAHLIHRDKLGCRQDGSSDAHSANGDNRTQDIKWSVSLVPVSSQVS